ncbi:hypothetical protein HDU84_006563 [Entophlyctis sp. JEL0112]|nr:hypothetical protein HDU84_006563 [Entophlyctis sp. JEL0112]
MDFGRKKRVLVFCRAEAVVATANVCEKVDKLLSVELAILPTACRVNTMRLFRCVAAICTAVASVAVAAPAGRMPVRMNKRSVLPALGLYSLDNIVCGDSAPTLSLTANDRSCIDTLTITAPNENYLIDFNNNQYSFCSKTYTNETLLTLFFSNSASLTVQEQLDTVSSFALTVGAPGASSAGLCVFSYVSATTTTATTTSFVSSFSSPSSTTSTASEENLLLTTSYDATSTTTGASTPTTFETSSATLTSDSATSTSSSENDFGTSSDSATTSTDATDPTDAEASSTDPEPSSAEVVTVMAMPTCV